MDDTERRLNVLFDGLNCETVPASVIDELTDIVKGLLPLFAQSTLSTKLINLSKWMADDMILK